ncbi:hypothetical protein BJ508DRAFT_140550 [Ascobolus immersus RN42]|uniref:Uncharacterized protein n=1 Tax=Ascobolus immersus RN42 TaxID=1160509 RepID=A0A3N4I282_ASCIM|nr:hypothetical protein BJ508DRAFT_140550 [Ascobolus immersus RN42]
MPAGSPPRYAPVTMLQVSLACESFNQHARMCHQCSDVGASFRRGDVPCSTGDALNQPIRNMFKQQQAGLERDFPGVDQDVIIDAAMKGPAYNLLSFLNERRRERARNTPSPVMHYAIPIPNQVRPHQGAYYRQTAQLEVGGRRYGHSRSGSDSSSMPSNSPQPSYYHPQQSHGGYHNSNLQVPGGPQAVYYVERDNGRREKKHVRFDSR